MKKLIEPNRICKEGWSPNLEVKNKNGVMSKLQKDVYEGEKYEKQMGSYTGKVSDRKDKRPLGMGIRAILTDNWLNQIGVNE